MAAREPMSDARSIWSLTVLCAGVGIIMVTLTSLYTAGPEMAKSTGASSTELTWIIDAYTLSLAGLLLPAGALGDRFGRKGMLILGFGMFTAAAIVMPFVQSPSGLIAVRFVLGAAAALALPSTLSIITSTFPPDFRDTAVNIWTAAFTLAGGLGVLVTAAMIEILPWRSSLWLAVIGGGLVFAASFTVPTSRDKEPPPLDLPGAILAAISITGLVYGLIQAGLRGWDDPQIIAALSIGVVGSITYWIFQLNRSNALLDVRLFAIRPFGVSALTVTAAFCSVYGAFFLSMQYEQFVLGYGPLQAAAPIAAMAVTVVPISLVADRLTARFGLRWVISMGMCLSALGYGVLLLCEQGSPYWLVYLVFLFIGAGCGLNMAPCTAAIINNVSEEKQGIAAAVNHTTREIGTALGVALVGGVLSLGYSENVAQATERLPAPAQDASEESIAGALAVAEQLGPRGEGLADAARDAFMVGAHQTSLVMIGLLLAVAIIAAFWAPPLRRQREEEAAREAAERAAAVLPPPPPMPIPAGASLAAAAPPPPAVPVPAFAAMRDHQARQVRAPAGSWVAQCDAQQLRDG